MFRYLILFLALNTSLLIFSLLFKHTSSDIYAFCRTSLPHAFTSLRLNTLKAASPVALGPKIMVLLLQLMWCVYHGQLSPCSKPSAVTCMVVYAFVSLRNQIFQTKKPCAKLICERSVPNRVGIRTMLFVCFFCLFDVLTMMMMTTNITGPLYQKNKC